LALPATVARADTIVATTFTHTSSRTDLLTSSFAVFNGIRAVNNTSITRNRDTTFPRADNRLTTYIKSKLSGGSRTRARVLEAERSLRSSTLRIEGTSETLTTSASSVGLETGKSSIRISIRIVAVVINVGVNPFAVVRSSISGTASTTHTSSNTRSSRAGAEFTRIAGRGARPCEEIAAISLSPAVLISIAVVSNIPTSGFEESKSEFRRLHLINQTRGHDFVSELSSFEMATSSTRRTSIFHISTLERGAAEVASKLGGKRLSINDLGSITIESSRSDMTSESLTVAVEPVAEQTVTETKSVDDFMHNADHVSFVKHDIRSGIHVSTTDGSVSEKRSLGTRSQRAGRS